MQSGGGAQQGGGGHGRNMVAGPPSSSASPSSSSSAVSATQFGFDSMLQQQHQQQQQQQQQQQRQSLQQQLLRKPEGKEAMPAYQSVGLHGVLGGNNFPSGSASMQLPQQSRKLMDFAQQHGRDDAHIRGQGIEPQMMNPMHQAYMQYALQGQQAPQKSIFGMQAPQQMKIGMVGPSGKDQDPRMGNIKMQDLISMQAGQHMVSDQRSDQDQKTSALPKLFGQVSSGNILGPFSTPQSQSGVQNMGNNQLAMAAQMQAMQALALERNIDLSLPANSHLVAQLIPLMQSRILAQQKPNENNVGPQSSSISLPKQQATSPQVANESSPRANSSSEASGQSGSNKPRQTVLPIQFGTASNAMLINNPSNSPAQQFSVHGRENQLPPRELAVSNGMSSRQPPQSSMNMNQASLDVGLGNLSTSQITPGPQSRKSSAFTKQQLHVLKAQILAFRRLKKGEGTLPRELLQAIAPPPLEAQVQQRVSPAVTVNHDRPTGRSVEDHTRHSGSSERELQSSSGLNNLEGEALTAVEKASAPAVNILGVTAVVKEPAPVVPSENEEPKTTVFPAKIEQEVDRGSQMTPVSDTSLDKGKAVATQEDTSSDTAQVKKAVQAGNAAQPKDATVTRKYHGPLFDFPFFTRKHDAFGSSMMMNNNNNLTLAYDVKDILGKEGLVVLNEKRSETIRKIHNLLAVNLEKKMIRPDLVLKLQIEEKLLRLSDVKSRVREDVEEMQQEIMAMPDRVYRKFARLCQRQRNDLARQLQASQKVIRDKQLKSIFQWRKKLLEAHWGIRDARTARNRGVAKYHERMLREFSKRKDDGRNQRMEALKNNDVERYREMLLEQQTSVPGEAAERYEVLSSFLSQTEDYLHKLGSKITVAKNQQEVEEAANAAAAAARAQGLSEEEVRTAASCAGEEVMIRNRFSEMNAPRDEPSANKYYTLAHAVNERVIRQPSMLRMGTLRDYQLVGLQWMLSLYNNKLNGILADEMGLGKTVQVMALIAYLMEFKGNYGPHLIIVPNAVLVNWKSELRSWLPSVSCIYYVGGKDQRSKLFSQEVCAMKFNVLVTTYEFIMFDRSKLSKVDWKYIIIDEAQRMKDRESVLARDLDRYRCQRRLLLTGTPLQNDLKELWSLLNLLLPEVFDNQKAFHDWFSKPFQKETQTAEDDWLETEKKVIIIHRLHQILEPFMLRRRVEDVEGSLPPKISIILRCRMSAIQGTIYDWIKSTGTLRVDPEDEKLRVQRSSHYTAKAYKNLNNKCMELRKTCNHPLLTYPYFNDFSKDFLVKSCGKLWVLDRILIKLQRTGHRVLLFSTMTKLLDILEEYLQWRRLVYRRIDGTTSLEDRESAIVEFNRPDTDCFIFLLSIRAAGRGLNLQTADTVIIYDPDPNPKNEEQAVARAHRIGQKREVKVIYLEAVVDKVPSYQKEDEYRNGSAVDSEDDDLAGKDRYIGSIESLIRNNIQQYKIEMADEVINAGRFDQRTTHEERRLTLETLLHDEERYQETVHDVPSLQQVNRMIARSEEEVELFDQMDEEFDWEEEMTRYDEVPKWLRAGTREVNTAIASLSKKPSKNLFDSETVGVESSEVEVTQRKRGRPKGKKVPNYAELDDDAGFSEASDEERNEYSGQEEGEDNGESEDEEAIGTAEAPSVVEDHLEPHESIRNNHILEQAGSSGSSAGSRRVKQMISPSLSSQKFGSLSALDGRPGSGSKRRSDDLEEGEITLSGDSPMGIQRSGSWTHDREEGEEEQVLQPKIKRKRSFRARPRNVVERNGVQGRIGTEHILLTEPSTYKADLSDSSLKSKQSLPSRKNPNKAKTSTPLRPSRMSASQEVVPEHPRESWDGKVNMSKMPEGIQRRCKNVLGKIQRRIDREGQQIIPLLTDLWKRNEVSGSLSRAGNNLLDLRKIEQRVDRFEYNGVMEFVADVQLMLKMGMNYFGFNHEVRSEARKVHELFFDVLKIAFPDTDFREARSAISFSSSAAVSSPSIPSPRQVLPGQNKRPRMSNEVKVKPDPIPPQRSSLRGPIEEPRTLRTHQVPQRETRFGVSSSSSGREVVPQEEPRPFTHPGELVICKKKRKDREKSGVKIGNMSVGPVSPPGISRGIRSPNNPSSIPKDMRLNQQISQQQSGSSSIGWANPVKRMRTDAGKRRPSHL